jgi:hypothetical protein
MHALHQQLLNPQQQQWQGTTTTTIFKVLAHLSNARPAAVKQTICKQISRLAQATQMLWTSHMQGRKRRR